MTGSAASSGPDHVATGLSALPQHVRTDLAVLGVVLFALAGTRLTEVRTTYHFCSTACKHAFEETPEAFAMIDPVISDGHDHH